jgi:hypothetical protein
MHQFTKRYPRPITLVCTFQQKGKASLLGSDCELSVTTMGEDSSSSEEEFYSQMSIPQRLQESSKRKLSAHPEDSK